MQENSQKHKCFTTSNADLEQGEITTVTSLSKRWERNGIRSALTHCIGNRSSRCREFFSCTCNTSSSVKVKNDHRSSNMNYFIYTSHHHEVCATMQARGQCTSHSSDNTLFVRSIIFCTACEYNIHTKATLLMVQIAACTLFEQKHLRNRKHLPC